MRYAIIVNPASGGMTPERKRILLREPAGILNAEIYGLGARNPEEFNECIVRTALQCDALVGAGGDGTLANIVNVIDRSMTPVGFLPLGSGNALRHALRLRGSLADIALQIRDAPIRQFDLIDCEGKVAFSASVGIDAAVLRVREKYPRLRKRGFCAYMFAALVAYFRTYSRASGLLEVDGLGSRFTRLLTLLVVKHPYHGFRMRVVPEAQLDDGRLHVLAVTSGFWKSIFWGVAAFFNSNRIGEYHTGKNVRVVLDQPLSLQADGEEWRQARAFRFEVLHKAIMVKA